MLAKVNLFLYFFTICAAASLSSDSNTQVMTKCNVKLLKQFLQECLKITDSCNLANVDELRHVIGTIGRRLRQRLPPDFYLYSRQQLRAAVRSKYRRITTQWFHYRSLVGT